ncbi:hypothetical protein KYC5002_50880 [Archangium violaceum]|uniref:hypothetical protein n=1 Tax=Archangium violaceum TaxID=83451 RepID=UPI002B2EE020|nr:hypothetical protein KYC5002_50880 [Archangium gephyra]
MRASACRGRPRLGEPWHSRHVRFFLLLCLPLWAGCAAMGTLRTADTVGAGKTRWSTQLS